ncbi:hypothetical protein NIES4103_27940 [Nostoc sp. NIES-4103]|nr:hypothetical protein NIES4103_27940 [Nostoc sp. NIES-4103]
MADQSLQQLKQQSQYFAAEQVRVQKELEEVERKLREQKEFADMSARRVCDFLRKFTDWKIDTGALTETDCTNLFTRLKETYGPQKTLEAYVRVVVKLLTHETYGVECKTYRVSNGGLIWKGKEYETAIALYDAFVELLGEPWGHHSWFLELLKMALDEDKTKLPADVEIPERLTTITNLLNNIVVYERNPVPTPDISQLTEEDALFISTVLGVF